MKNKNYLVTIAGLADCSERLLSRSGFSITESINKIFPSVRASSAFNMEEEANFPSLQFMQPKTIYSFLKLIFPALSATTIPAFTELLP